MAYEAKEGSISIFKNDNRTKDTAPTHRGTVLINGQEYKIALWPKQGEKGPFLAGTAKIDDYQKPEPVPASAVDDFIAPAQSNPAQNEQIPGVAELTQPAPVETGDDLPFIWLLLVGLTGLGTLSQILPTIQLPI